jgi:hypothetical protein
VGRHSGGNVCGRLLLNVKTELVSHVSFPIFAREPSPPEIHGHFSNLIS